MEIQKANEQKTGSRNFFSDVAIFDVDGTLVDTLPHVYRSIVKAHEKFKLKPPLLDQLRSVYDQSDRFRKCCRSLKIPEHLIEEYNFYVYEFFKKDIRQNRPKLIPTVPQILRIFKNRGIYMKILSLDNYDNTIYKLGEGLFKEIFSEILSPEQGKDLALQKFKSEHEFGKVTYIGDCVSDGEAALSAGIDFIGLATPFSFSSEKNMVEFALANAKLVNYANSHFHMVSIYEGLNSDSTY